MQSTTMALMAAKGIIEPYPDACIFADTQAEPDAVAEHLEWLKTELPFPIHIVSKGDLKQDTLNALKPNGNKFITIPIFSKNPHTGKKSLLMRQCTNDYKIYHIETSLYNIAQDETKSLVWVGTFDIASPQNITTTVKDYVERIIKQMEKENVMHKTSLMLGCLQQILPITN